MTHKAGLDRLTLFGIRMHPRIGVSEEERAHPQECSADLAVWADFKAAASTDRLEAALDYCAILDRVLEVAHRGEYRLVETLAYRLAQSVLEAFPAARVNVKVRKRPAGLRQSLDCIEVEVEQS